MRLSACQATVVTANSQRAAELPFQARHQVVQLFDDGQHGVGLGEIDARFLQLLHRVVVAAGLQQRQIALARLAGAASPCMISRDRRAAEAKHVAYW